MSISLQFFMRPLPNNKMGIVGLLSTETPLPLACEMRHIASIQMTSDALTLALHQDISPDPMNDKFGSQLNSAEHNINGLLIYSEWERITSTTPDTAAGQLFIRQAQTFKDETGYRYIIAGAWDDSDAILSRALHGGLSLFAEGVGSSLNEITLKTETHVSDLCQGNNLGQALLQPIWRKGNDTFALTSDLYLPVMKAVFAYTEHVAATGTTADFQPEDSDVWNKFKSTVTSICNHFDDEDYLSYLQGMHAVGWSFTDNIHLRTPEQSKFFNFASRETINRIRNGEHA